MKANVKAETKDTRLVARVNDEVHQLVLAAAELSGSSITQFLVDAAVSKAREVTEQSMRLNLTMQGAERMLKALDAPPSPSEALLLAANKYKEQGFYDTEFPKGIQGA